MTDNVDLVGVHRCQPFVGLRGHDPAFALTYQRDPWCWAPTLGFHRSSDPTRPVALGVCRDKMAGPDAIGAYQALSLGYGHGTSNGDVLDGISAFVHRFCEIGQRVTFTDATPFAAFGRDARDYELLRTAPRSQRIRVHRQVFREAYDLMQPRPQALHRWRSMLDLASAGLPLSSGDMAWIEARSDEAWRVRHTPFGYRDLAAGHSLRGMLHGTHGNLSRGLVELYSLALPDEQSAARWLLRVGAAIQVNVAAARTAGTGPPAFPPSRYPSEIATERSQL